MSTRNDFSPESTGCKWWIAKILALFCIKGRRTYWKRHDKNYMSGGHFETFSNWVKPRRTLAGKIIPTLGILGSIKCHHRKKLNYLRSDLKSVRKWEEAFFCRLSVFVGWIDWWNGDPSFRMQYQWQGRSHWSAKNGKNFVNECVLRIRSYSTIRGEPQGRVLILNRELVWKFQYDPALFLPIWKIISLIFFIKISHTKFILKY